MVLIKEVPDVSARLRGVSRGCVETSVKGKEMFGRKNISRQKEHSNNEAPGKCPQHGNLSRVKNGWICRSCETDYKVFPVER